MQKSNVLCKNVNLSPILSETGLTSKMMRNNQNPAFQLTYTSAKTTDLFFVSSSMVLTTETCDSWSVSPIYWLMIDSEPL
jgi:hypothetical protein